MKLTFRDKQQLLAAAMGKTQSDLAIENIQYVNVFTGEVYPAVVYVHQGFVAHVEAHADRADSELARQIYNGGGQYLIPGFIDAHLHIESSMLTPQNFAAAVVIHGTTTAITDPHEIANVLGEEAVHYMHEAGKNVPMRQLINIPSCVPSVPGLENAGATFDADTIRRLAKLQNVHGLAEVMDFVGVVNGDQRMMDIIEAAEENGLYLQGHLPGGRGRMVSAYVIGGPRTCHESTTSEEAVDKIRAGMYIDARDSSICHNVEAIWDGVKGMNNFSRLNFCTDDREADDILYVGHIDDIVRKAIGMGMDPIQAIRGATIQSAEEMGCENLGAVAPGYAADMVLVDDLSKLGVNEVFFGGEMVAKGGQLIKPVEITPHPVELRSSMQVPELTIEDFRLKAPAGCGDQVKVNVMEYARLDQSLAELSVETLPVKDGYVDISGEDDLCYGIVINRYGKGTMHLGLVRGFGLTKGADASTVSHDSHNLTIVYRDKESAFACYEELKKVGGGICCAVDGEVLCTLPLAVAGLMSSKSWKETAADSIAMKKALREVGLNQPNPLLRIVTMALPVIPKVKFSDMGLVDVLKKELLPLFITEETAAGSKSAAQS